MLVGALSCEAYFIIIFAFAKTDTSERRAGKGEASICISDSQCGCGQQDSFVSM